MKKVTYGLVVIVLSIFASSLSLSTFARIALAQESEKIAPETKGTFMRPHGVIAITKTCGCEGKCPEGFTPFKVDKCYTKGGDCMEKEEKCTLHCRKSKEEKTADGKCVAVYTD